jgi:predicted dehydrogenase
MTLSLALIGCGVMGRRHILGLKALKDAGREPFQLAALCDPVAGSAAAAADLAAELLGNRPDVFPDLAALYGSTTVDAVDITTAPNLHLSVGEEALFHGAHVMVEKPIALTIGQGRALVAAAERTSRRLAVAENYRRDPINRLAKAALDAGLIGRPFLITQSSSGGGEKVIITPWRHRKKDGGIVVDMGVHYTDLFEYFLGPLDAVGGMSAVVDAERTDPDGKPHAVDAEDLSVGMARFRSGALANWLLSLAGRGESHFSRVIYGTGGSLTIPPDRSGQPLKLVQRRNGEDVAVAEEELLNMLPDFRLDDTTAALFGADRLSRYDRPWAATDAALLAIELDDFAGAIGSNRPPDVTGADGLRSLALVYGFLEADRLGRTVTLDELLTSDDLPYQAEIA